MIVAENTVVTMTYVVKDESGNLLDATHARSPVKYQVGSRERPKGLEKAIPGLKVGDKRIFEVKPEQGYGERKKDLVIRVSQSELPDDAGEPVAPSDTSEPLTDFQDISIPAPPDPAATP